MRVIHPTRRAALIGGAFTVAGAVTDAAHAEPAPDPSFFNSSDGAALSYRSVGHGRPTLLLHGLLVNAQLNWFDNGFAPRLAALGRQVVAPDFRGHGRSAAPADPAAYPPDVLAVDQEALVRHLGWKEFDLVGYSLGARMALRLLVRGARARRTVLGGLGDSGVTNVDVGRTPFFDYVRNGPKAANEQIGTLVWAMMKQAGDSPEPIVNVLNQQVSTPPELLAKLRRSVLVLAGDADNDNGNPAGLAHLIPGAQLERVTGNHLTALKDPAFFDKMSAYLQRPG